jgi:hypothetical protein
MNKVYMVLSIVLACAVLGLGQTDKSKQAPLANSGDRVSVISGTTLDAQLQKAVDVNNAKVGDEVVLKITKSIKQNGEVVVPKGTELIGRVTEVQRRTKENSFSKLGIVFDRIQGRDLAGPFSASIVSITNVAARTAAGDSLMTDTSATSQTAGSARGSSGGLLGGVGSTVGGLVDTTSQTVGTVTNTAVRTTNGAAGTVAQSLSGIQISSSASGSASSSSTLSSPSKNVRVEKGATFNLRVNGQVARQE